MKHQRKGHKGQQLIKQVQGYQISCERNSHRHTVGHQIIGKENRLPLLIPHILKRIQHRQGPQERNQTGKHTAQTVQTEHDPQVPIQLKQHHLLTGSRLMDNQPPNDQAVHQGNPFHKQCQPPVPEDGISPKMIHDQQDHTPDNGKERRNRQ